MTVVRIKDGRKPATLSPEIREFIRALALATAARDHKAEMAAKAAAKCASGERDG